MIPTPTLNLFSKTSELNKFDFSNVIAQFTQFFNSLPGFEFDFSGILATWKMIAFVITVLLSMIFMVILMKLRHLTTIEPSIIEELTPPEPAKGPLYARWSEILKHMDSAKEAEWKFAVIEADKLTDLVLQRAGFQGETMGDRMLSIQEEQLISLGDLWDAHKIRNRLVHDVDYFLRYTEAKQAIDRYEKALRELGAIS